MDSTPAPEEDKDYIVRGRYNERKSHTYQYQCQSVCGNLIRKLRNGGQPTGALSVDCVNAGLDRDSGVEGGHTSGTSTTTRGKDIANGDVLNEFGVKLDLGIGSMKDVGKDNLWAGILETTLFAL